MVNCHFVTCVSRQSGAKERNLKIFRFVVIDIYFAILSLVIIMFLLGINGKKEDEKINDYREYGYIEDELFSDFVYFPVALDSDNKNSILYENTYGDERTYGGDREHQGIDILDNSNKRGNLPIVSVCDGVIENVGWLELGGYRIGIRSSQGVYYYYAHLYRYEIGIEEGMEVKAGQIIGYMGDSGYSKVEGTVGNFPVHLHFGIYIMVDGNEITVNPYEILKKNENCILRYDF